MHLLIEEITDIEFFSESNNISGKKDYYIEGIFLAGNVMNGNGRKYPTKVLAEDVARYKKDFIDRRRAYGELDHPDKDPNVKLQRASHLIESLIQKGDNFIGKAKILNTPKGKTVKAIMDDGGQLGASSRAVGAINKKTMVVEKVFLTTAADIVHNPSAPGAFMENLMENDNWIFNGMEWVRTRRDDIHSTLNKQEREVKMLKLFEDYITSLKNPIL